MMAPTELYERYAEFGIAPETAQVRNRSNPNHAKRGSHSLLQSHMTEPNVRVSRPFHDIIGK
jgi:hypothetical protein